MVVFIDSREPQKIVNYAKRFNFDFDIKTLIIGDFVNFEKNLCIERKSINDYICSLRSGHLQKQLFNMQNNFKNNYLIISGDFKNVFFNSNIRNFSVEVWLGSLASLAVRYNVQILQVANDSQLLKLVFKIDSKTGDGRGIVKDFVSLHSSRDDFLNVLSCVSGVSVLKARSIKKKYSSFSVFYSALNNDLFSVKGFGVKLVKNLKKVFL